MVVIDWDQVGKEAAALLGALIRADTSNPPGSEHRAAEVLARVLTQANLAPRILEAEPGRSNLICQLDGEGNGDQLMLLSHLDVVPASREGWQRDPFGGELVDGYVWGRGALDTKNLTVMQTLCLLLLQRRHIPLRRGVLLVATADEERGGKFGAQWLVEYHPDLLHASYVINEGGGHDILVGSQRYYLCQTGEKGTCRAMVTVTDEPGHGAMPRRRHAIGGLAAVIGHLAKHPFPYRTVPTSRALLEVLAERSGTVFAEVLDRLDSGTLTPEGLDALPLPRYFAPELHAMLRDTFTPTMVTAGTQINVIPPKASAQFDGRILPDTVPEAMLETIRAHATCATSCTVELTPLTISSGLEFPHRTPFFAMIEAAVARHDSGAVVVPYLCPGGTDARHLRALPGTIVYGFKPMQQRPEAPREGLVHGLNERVSVENLVFGTRVLFDIVSRWCGFG